MANTIEHNGIVKSIDDDHHLTVRIVQVSACATCSVKGHCSSADSKEKLIHITDYDARNYKPGDSVQIIGTTTMGMKAVTLAFVIPFLLMILTLFTTMYLTGNELLSAIGALIILFPYYILLHAGKNRMKKNFSFTIKQINN